MKITAEWLFKKDLGKLFKKEIRSKARALARKELTPVVRKLKAMSPRGDATVWSDTYRLQRGRYGTLHENIKKASERVYKPKLGYLYSYTIHAGKAFWIRFLDQGTKPRRTKGRHRYGSDIRYPAGCYRGYISVSRMRKRNNWWYDAIFESIDLHVNACLKASQYAWDKAEKEAQLARIA